MLNWYPLSFDSDGNALDPNQVDGPDGIATALFGLPDQPVSDLWVLSYGWNTSIDDGDVFYDTWVNLLRAQMQQANLPDYHPMFIGVFWPSKAFTDADSNPGPAPALGAKADFIQAHRPIYDPELKQDDGTFEQDFG